MSPTLVTIFGFLPPALLAAGVALYLALDAWVLHPRIPVVYEDDTPPQRPPLGPLGPDLPEIGAHVRRHRIRKRRSSDH